MADSEEFRLKRLKHEEQMSRMFDEVMGLGDFADSSRGSVASSKSGGQTDTKGLDETSEQKENQPVEEDSSCSKREERVDEGTGEMSFPHTSSPPDKPSLFNIERGVRGSGEAACDDALDGLPSYGQEEEDEDWHFALPMGSMEDVDLGKTNSKISRSRQENSASRGDPFARKPRAEEEEQQEREGSGESANTSHSSQDDTPENSRDVLNQREETEDSQQAVTKEAAPVEDSNPPVSPGVKIKDEPIDEGYDAALLPQSSIRQIKEELEQQEEELRISSVYSVGGANTFTSPAMPAAIPAPTQTAIFIPGRGAVLQAMAPLSVRPPALIPPSLPTLTTLPRLPPPPQPPVPGSVRCSGCSKVLLKGQTAFQRKGSTQLFCSTVCLTGHLPPAVKMRSCFQCNREILQPRDMVTVPTENNTFMQFCGQFCLSVFRHKRKQGEKIPDKRLEKRIEKPPEKPLEYQPEKPFCTVCKSTKKIEHEVTHQGRLHKLCSDTCFQTWRKLRQLAMNCCEGCGLYCNSSSGSCQTLSIEKSQLNFCSPTCVSTYRQTCRKKIDCANCRKTAVVSSTIMERDQKGKVQLYCSSTCVEQSRPSQHALTGTPFPCCLCKVSAVPQYHLAMVDGTIRNFCSYACVSLFRKSDHTSQPDLTNGTSSLRDPPNKDAAKPGPSAGTSSVPPVPQDYPSSVPYPSHSSTHTSVPPLVPPSSATSSPTVPGQAQAQSPPDETQKSAVDGFSDAVKVSCHQCSKQFNTKPLLFSHQDRIFMFCSKTCSDQFKTLKNIVALCESCKQEKVVFENFNYDQHDLFFCSESCMLLFKNNHLWHPCTYCSAIGQKMVLSHYGGKTEEFCKPHCMSQFTVLYYGMGRCDGCRKQGYMTEKLQCLGSVRNFCNMSCLLRYCFIHFEMSQHTSSNGTIPQMPCAPAQPHHSSKMNPIIADVVSLANGSAAQPSVSANTSLTGALPTSSVDGKNLDHASTQTDAMRVPAPRRRQMKNKSVLCRPFTTDQEIMCQLPAASTETEALLDRSSQFNGPSTSPPRSPKPPLSNNVPARLTGRHFLGKKENNLDCVVCSQRKKKRMRRLEEAEAVRKKRKMEGEDLEKKKEEVDPNTQKIEVDDPERKKEEEVADQKIEEDDPERKKEEEVADQKIEENDPERKMEEGVADQKIEEVDPERKKEEGVADQKIEEDDPERKMEEGVADQKIEVDDPERKMEEGVADQKIEEDDPERKKEEGVADQKMEEDNLQRQKEEEVMGQKTVQEDPELIKEDDSERNKEEEEEDGGSYASEEETDEEEESDSGPAERQTSYYCKTCSEEPSLCPVPCFELYHTQLVYRTAPELETQATAKEDNVKMVMVPVPVPVPVFIPVPINVFSQHMPVPMVIPMPVPVPIVVPPQKKNMKDAEVQFETFGTKEENKEVSSSGQRSSSEDVNSEVVTPTICEDEQASEAADLPQTVCPVTSIKSADPRLENQPETSKTVDDPPSSSTKDQPPSSPLMDLEADFPPELVNHKVQQRGVKRSRDSSYSRKRARRRTGGRSVLGAPVTSKLNHLYGIKAWRSWVQQHNKQPQKSSGVEVKEDILQCNSSELSIALSRFIQEVRRPNGEPYSPDSIFYLCLGIQQYLFEQGRIENIFTDELYSQFVREISGMLRLWKPKLLLSGGLVPSRVEESYLWECKQLGAYSPMVLLNTLLFFCTKKFHLTTVAQHQRLSFFNLTRQSKPCSRVGQVTSLHYQRSSTATSGSEQTERIKKCQAENVRDLELLENVSNPLQCPVRLYEFYLSRCPESVKKRTNVFYLQPEQSVHTNSPHWYTRQPLDTNTLQSMLTRILAVREVQQEAGRRSAAAEGDDE